MPRFEKMVLDADLLDMVAEFLRPVVVNDEELALDAMREVGPGGHFFGCAHTQARYRNAFFAPMISDWRNYESWQEAGSPTAYDTANRLYKQRLAAYRGAADGSGHSRGTRSLCRPPQGRGRRADRLLTKTRGRCHEVPCPGSRDRRRRRRRPRALSPDESRLEGRAADRTVGAHVRLHLARGRGNAHDQRRPERRQAAAIYDQALQGDRGDLRRVLRRSPDRRPDARRHARAHGLAEDGLCPRAVSRHATLDMLSVEEAPSSSR